jgi:hypothetical protein
LFLLGAFFGGYRVKIIYDPDIPATLRSSIKDVIKESIDAPCSCGCDEIYVSLQNENRIDVKCYDCGTSFFELEVEVNEERIDS